MRKIRINISRSFLFYGILISVAALLGALADDPSDQLVLSSTDSEQDVLLKAIQVKPSPRQLH